MKFPTMCKIYLAVLSLLNLLTVAKSNCRLEICKHGHEFCDTTPLNDGRCQDCSLLKQADLCSYDNKSEQCLIMECKDAEIIKLKEEFKQYMKSSSELNNSLNRTISDLKNKLTNLRMKVADQNQTISKKTQQLIANETEFGREIDERKKIIDKQKKIIDNQTDLIKRQDRQQIENQRYTSKLEKNLEKQKVMMIFLPIGGFILGCIVGFFKEKLINFLRSCRKQFQSSALCSGCEKGKVPTAIISGDQSPEKEGLITNQEDTVQAHKNMSEKKSIRVDQVENPEYHGMDNIYKAIENNHQAKETEMHRTSVPDSRPPIGASVPQQPAQTSNLPAPIHQVNQPVASEIPLSPYLQNPGRLPMEPSAPSPQTTNLPAPIHQVNQPAASEIPLSPHLLIEASAPPPQTINLAAPIHPVNQPAASQIPVSPHLQHFGRLPMEASTPPPLQTRNLPASIHEVNQPAASESPHLQQPGRLPMEAAAPPPPPPASEIPQDPGRHQGTDVPITSYHDCTIINGNVSAAVLSRGHNGNANINPLECRRDGDEQNCGSVTRARLPTECSENLEPPLDMVHQDHPRQTTNC